MTGPAIIRSAKISDADAIVPLLAELGYPASSREVVARLDRLATTENSLVLVAERDNEVVGLVTGHMFASIHTTGPVAWLTTLVVRDDAQALGVGRELVAAVEKWAQRNGAVRISVTSGNHRAGAHKFYERCGYESSGVRLTKVLDIEKQRRS
jgi:predicted N-acetyltransferase YhbS